MQMPDCVVSAGVGLFKPFYPDLTKRELEKALERPGEAEAPKAAKNVSARLMNTKATARYLGMSVAMFHARGISMKLTKIRIFDKRVLYDRQEVDEYIESMKGGQA